MTKSPSDGDEIAAIASGSQEAFAAFVGRYQQGLRGFLRRTCGDWALADDLAQETFVTAWSRISGLRPGGSLRGWLFGIAYRKALAALRSNRRRTAREDDYQRGLASSHEPRHEDRLSLEQALATLPTDQRAVVALCLAADFSHAEAAATLALPLGTVKSHALRGRAKLHAALGGHAHGA